MSKNLIFCGQLLQTNAWYRGMGKYCLQLLQQINENPGGYKLHLIFNSNIECDRERYEVIKYLCPNIEQVFVSLPVATDRSASERSYRRQLSQHLSEKFKGDDNYFVITSLFSWDFFAAFPANCRKVLLFYDLTPMLLWRDLGGYFPPALYMGRFKYIYEADKILTISETVRRDVLKLFGFKPDKVVNINGGFSRPSDNPKRPAGFDVPESYVLFVSGDMPHKNNELAARGYNRFVKESGSKTKLVVTSSYLPKHQKLLSGLCPSMVFSGNVRDEELEWLYQNAEAVLFASKYEGLGIPILDAVYNQKPVIASKIPVFEEMLSSKNAFYFFSPDSEDELAAALKAGLAKKNFEKYKQAYPAIMAKYTWAKTVGAFIDGVNKTIKRKRFAKEPTKKIAVVSLNPGIGDQLGRLAEQLFYLLTKDFLVDYYFDSCGVHYKKLERPTFLDYVGVWTADIDELTTHRYKHYEEVIYIVDNAALNFKIARLGSVLPGIAISQFDDGSLSRRGKIIKEVFLDNQKDILHVSRERDLYSIADWLKGYFASGPKHSKNEEIIRGGHFKAVLIKRLLRDNR